MSDYIGRPCGSVCGIPEDAHQTEEHPWVAAREPAGAGLREAVKALARSMDDWLASWPAPSPDDRTAIRAWHTSLRAALASPAEPGLDVERLARALYLVQWDGYDALIDLADDPEEWFYPPLILARLISDQWEAALSEPKP